MSCPGCGMDAADVDCGNDYHAQFRDEDRKPYECPYCRFPEGAYHSVDCGFRKVRRPVVERPR